MSGEQRSVVARIHLQCGQDQMSAMGGPVKTQIHNDRDHNLACFVVGHRRSSSGFEQQF